MKRRSLLLLAASSACQSKPSDWQLARAVIRVAGASPAEEHATIDGLERIAERARYASTAGQTLGSALRAVLFDELGFAREVERTELGFVLLPSVLRHRRGSCVGLGTLYLSLAQNLGLAARGVLMPGHFYVKHWGATGGEPQNVELLRRGEPMPDGWYLTRYPIPAGRGREVYARSLTTSEVLGVIEYDIGNERRRQQRVAEARQAYTRAAELIPALAPVHASLGATEHLLGELPSALSSYERARDLEPSLPGLDRNIDLLRAEQSKKVDL